MSQGRFSEVYKYLKKYIEQKEEHSDYIDYYELYDLDRNMSVSELKNEIKEKKLRILFHPDQVSSIEGYFKEAFKENSIEVLKMINILSDQNLRDRYDSELEEFKKKTYEDKDKHQSSEYATVEYNEKDLEIAMETTIYKQGFYNGYYALNMAIRDNYNYVTRENGARERVRKLGSDSIKRILYDKRKVIMEDQSLNCIMDYYNDIINKTGLSERANSFYSMCLGTALIYDTVNDLGQLSFALGKFIDQNDSSAFFNYDNRKQDFQDSNINSYDAWILMMAKIHSKREENEDYSFANMSEKSHEQQIKTFSKIMIKEAKEQAEQRKSVV